MRSSRRRHSNTVAAMAEKFRGVWTLDANNGSDNCDSIEANSTDSSSNSPESELHKNDGATDVLIHHGIKHTNQAFNAIGQMKNRDELCDVELIVDGNCLRAHKLILASFSPYFHAMFTGQLAESHKNTITLYDVNFEALKILVDYTYTSVIDINQDNVQVRILQNHNNNLSLKSNVFSPYYLLL